MGAMRSTLVHTDMVSSERHVSDLQTHSRLPESHSRHTVKERPSPPHEWSLHPQVFQEICQLHVTLMIDLFATRFNNKLLLFVSPVPDPKALHVDSMSMDWTGEYRYVFTVFPPLACIP
jgi:hypothetical protein